MRAKDIELMRKLNTFFQNTNGTAKKTVSVWQNQKKGFEDGPWGPTTRKQVSIILMETDHKMIELSKAISILDKTKDYPLTLMEENLRIQAEEKTRSSKRDKAQAIVETDPNGAELIINELEKEVVRMEVVGAESQEQLPIYFKNIRAYITLCFLCQDLLAACTPLLTGKADLAQKRYKEALEKWDAKNKPLIGLGH